MQSQQQQFHPGAPAAYGLAASPLVLALPHDQQVNTDSTAEEPSQPPAPLDTEDGSYQAEESEEDSDPPRRFTRKRLPHPIELEDDSRQAEESEGDSDRPQPLTRRLRPRTRPPIPITEGSTSTEESEEDLPRPLTKRLFRNPDAIDTTAGSHQAEESEKEEYGGRQPLTEENLRRFDEQTFRAGSKTRRMRRWIRDCA